VGDRWRCPRRVGEELMARQVLDYSGNSAGNRVTGDGALWRSVGLLVIAVVVVNGICIGLQIAAGANHRRVAAIWLFSLAANCIFLVVSLIRFAAIRAGASGRAQVMYVIAAVFFPALAVAVEMVVTFVLGGPSS
jgi:hypothetical protein